MKLALIIFAFLLALPLTSAAHYIIGIVNNAKDSTPANEHTVVLWNPSIGIQDNQTDIIGVNGNSGTDNIYMIDCEMLNSACNVGDTMRVKVIDSGDSYISSEVSVAVTGAGYDLADNLTLNSPPNITSISVDDSIPSPENEIDLTPASTTSVFCEAVVKDFDGEDSIENITSVFFDISSSNSSASDDNNNHYTNSSCSINKSYGDSNELKATCGFEVWYYANNADWKCEVTLTDNLSVSNNSDSTYVNPLLALGIDSLINYTGVVNNNVSNESIVNITNFGNIIINLSLVGYGVTEGDNLSMFCNSTNSKNISVEYEKYNLTSSNPGAMELSEFEAKYTNLTSAALTRETNLNYRQDDSVNDAIMSTSWRIYVPAGVGGSCSGNIIFGARQGAGS
jgi:hypothetical protein